MIKVFLGSVAWAIVWAAGTFVATFFAVFVAFGIIYGRQYPHDGQNGLGAALMGFYSAVLLTGVTLVASFLVIFLRRANAA